MPRSLEGSIIFCVVMSVLGYTLVFASKTVKCKIPTYKSASKKGDGEDTITSCQILLIENDGANKELLLHALSTVPIGTLRFRLKESEKTS